MKSLRQFRWVTTLTVVVIAVAWVLGSNHCAFAALKAAANTEHSCCREGKKGHPQETLSMQCCEAFNVPMPDQLDVPVGHYYELKPVWPETPAALAPNFVRVLESKEPLDTGPPHALTFFVEIVLNRSLLAHAPPHFVA